MMNFFERRLIVVVVICYMAGILLVNHYTSFKGVGELSSIPALPELLEAVGTITGDPEPRMMARNESCVWTFPFKVEAIKGSNGVWNTVEFTTRASFPGYSWTDVPEYGEIWHICAKVRESANLRTGERVIWLEIDRSGSEFVSNGAGGVFHKICYKGRKKAAGLLSMGIESHKEEVALLHALLLGYRGGFAGPMRKLFSDTGTLHIFAISGLHVGIIAFLIIRGLGFCRVSRVHWIIYLAPMLVFYTISTGGRASAVRACIMTIVYYLGPLVGRKADIVSSLALAALLILFVDAGQLFDVGFIYSFVVMTGIVTFVPLLEPIFTKYFKVDSMRIQQEAMSVFLVRKVAQIFMGMVAVSVSAWVVSTPLTIFFFQRFSPIGLVSNMVVIPLAFLIVATGCVSLIMGSCCGLFAIAMNNLNLIWITMLVKTMKALASVPFANIELTPLPVSGILLFYVALVFFRLLPVSHKMNNRKGRGYE